MKMKIIQYHPSVIESDAIGSSIKLLHRALRGSGVESYVACSDTQRHNRSPGLMSASDVLNAKMGTSLSNSDLLLLHFSFYDDIIERLVELPLNCVLVYHNITPGSFFREVGLEHLANACDGGRKQLNYLAERCKFAVADSNFNGKDLTESGFGDVRTIPVMFNEENLRNKEDRKSVV